MKKIGLLILGAIGMMVLSVLIVQGKESKYLDNNIDASVSSDRILTMMGDYTFIGIEESCKNYRLTGTVYKSPASRSDYDYFVKVKGQMHRIEVGEWGYDGTYIYSFVHYGCRYAIRSL